MSTISTWLNAVFVWIKSLFTNKEPAIALNPLLAPINEQLAFAHSSHLSLGVELELSIIDPVSFAARNIAQQLIDELKDPNIHQEAAAHIIEITTGICSDVKQVEKELLASIEKVEQCAAQSENTVLCGTGRTTLLNDSDLELYKSERYNLLKQRRQFLYKKFNSMQGLHIHLGMRNAEECIRYHNFFTHFLPHILAISASTPIENSINTGLASARSIAGEALPIAGLPYHFNNWQEYENLCNALVQAGSICSLKDLNWDLRPCPRLGTLEIRVADQPATLAGCMAIVAFVHSLALWFEEHHSWIDEMPRPSGWRMRDNKWRAMRYALDAQIVINNQGATRDLRTDILLWIKRIEHVITRRGYQPYIETLRQTLFRGNSSQRQITVLGATDNLAAVADFNLREWRNRSPLWDEVDDIKLGAKQPGNPQPVQRLS